LFFLIFINDFEVSVNRIVFVIILSVFDACGSVACTCSSSGRTGTGLPLSLLAGRLVYLLRRFSPSAIQLFHSVIKFIYLLLFVQLFDLLKRCFDLLLIGIRDFILMLIQLFLGREDQAVGLVELLGTLTNALIFISMLFGRLLHLFDLLFGQAGRRFDADTLFLAGAFIFGAYVQHAIGVNIEVNFNLRNSARCRWNTVQVEASQRSVVLSFGTSAL